MFRHRKRLIAKRLTNRMNQRNQKAMKKLFKNFIQSRASKFQSIKPKQKYETIEEQQLISQQQSISDQMIEHNSKGQFGRFTQEQEDDTGLQNYELPQTFFMNKKQKIKYFASKSQYFQKKLKSTPQRNSKNNKKVIFQQSFVFKPFNDQQKVKVIQKAKQYKQKYDNKIHFS